MRRIERDYLVVAETRRGYGTWYVPDTDDFHVGQSVRATGMLAPGGTFYPQTINGRNLAYDTDRDRGPARSVRPITLSGIVRRVGGHTLAVWEPARRTEGTWVVNDAFRFRVGQRVTGTGTEDRAGRFYPSRVSLR